MVVGNLPLKTVLLSSEKSSSAYACNRSRLSNSLAFSLLERGVEGPALAPRRRKGGVKMETDEPGVVIADERLGKETFSSSWMPVRTRGFKYALSFSRRNGFAAVFGSSLLHRQNVL